MRIAAASCILLFTFSIGLVAQASSQPASAERVRVPTGHANVHMGPSSGSEVLVLVRRDTVLEVLGRDREWIQVRLTPEMRKTGMVMRWYKNEDRGWMHDSTVQAVSGRSGGAGGSGR